MSTELRSLLRQTIEDHPLADPREIARFAAKLAPSNQVRSFLEEALVDMAGQMLGENRRQAFDSGKAANTSRKVNQRRSWWADVLASLVHVGGSHWKPLGDCDRGDLLFVIDERRKLITNIEDQIRNYEHLLKLLKQNKVDTVSQLPAQTGWPK